MFKIAPVQCALTNQTIASSSARISPYSSFFLLSQLLVPSKYLKDSIPLWLSKIIHVNIDIFHHTTYVKIIKFLLVRVSFYNFIHPRAGKWTPAKKNHIQYLSLQKFPKHCEFFNNSENKGSNPNRPKLKNSQPQVNSAA